jgi:hypothetical protein
MAVLTGTENRMMRDGTMKTPPPRPTIEHTVDTLRPSRKMRGFI